MMVICEGIETEYQLAYLEFLQCDIGQGFLLGRPVSREQFREMWVKPKRQTNSTAAE